MSDEEILAFLTRWVMEYGSSTFNWRKDGSPFAKGSWYVKSPISIKTKSEMHKFFDLGWTASHDGIMEIKINKKGLDFITNYERKTS